MGEEGIRPPEFYYYWGRILKAQAVISPSPHWEFGFDFIQNRHMHL
jgi:hypothetical protein